MTLEPKKITWWTSSSLRTLWWIWANKRRTISYIWVVNIRGTHYRCECLKFRTTLWTILISYKTYGRKWTVFRPRALKLKSSKVILRKMRKTIRPLKQIKRIRMIKTKRSRNIRFGADSRIKNLRNVQMQLIWLAKMSLQCKASMMEWVMVT